jgi:hypothetical protein
MAWWSGMAIDTVLTKVRQHVGSFKQCWMCQEALTAAFWHANLRNKDVLTFILEDANFQHCCGRSITWILYRSISMLDTDLVSLKFTSDLLTQVLRIDLIFLFFCSQRTAHCGQVREFVLLNFAFCSYTKPSPVRTDHYFCCFVLRTHSLHHEIMLLVKEWNKGLMLQLNWLQLCNKVLLQTRFQSAIQPVVIVLINSKEHCSKRQMV